MRTETLLEHESGLHKALARKTLHLRTAGDDTGGGGGHAHASDMDHKGDTMKTGTADVTMAAGDDTGGAHGMTAPCAT